MIVIDTNVVACLHLGSPAAIRAEAWLRQDAEWAAPHLWRSEFRNVLVNYLRRGDLTLAAATQCYESAEALLRGREHFPDPALVLQLAAQSGHSAYDCEFVALAMELDAPLLTGDRRLARSFPDWAIPLGGD